MTRLVHELDRAIEALAAILVIALLGSVALGVLTRGWNDPLAWTDELARFLMVWLAMLGWVISSRRGAHVRIRFFQNLLPPSLWRGTELVIQAAMSALGGLVAWFGVDLVGRNLDLEATSLPVSMAWMYVPLIPAGIATFLQGLADIAGQLRRPAASAPLEERLVE